jgi:hypothetical protein
MGIVIGSRFGKLVVLEDAGSINGHPAFFCMRLREFQKD